MKKMIFKVTILTDFSLASILKEINGISCQIHFDNENSLLTAENVDLTMIDTVINIVKKYYQIDELKIDNIENHVLETVKQVVEPKAEDNIATQILSFKSKKIEKAVQIMISKIVYGMLEKNVPEQTVLDYIYTLINEFSIAINPGKTINFSVGDIVTINFGAHLPGEIQGNYTLGIVCRSFYNLVFIVPIAKATRTITSHAYLSVDPELNAKFYSNFYVKGFALLDKGKYIRFERITNVIGKASDELFSEIIRLLPSAFDFSAELSCKVDGEVSRPEAIPEEIDVSSNDSELVSEEADWPANNFYNASAEVSALSKDSEVVSNEDNETEIASKTNSDKNNSSIQKVSSKTHSKMLSTEAALYDAIGPALDNLNISVLGKNQITQFMSDIQMDTSQKLVVSAFEIACKIEKIGYVTIVSELHKINSNISEEIISASLKESFKRWLKNYPDLEKEKPKISIMDLLKAFTKRVKCTI